VRRILILERKIGRRKCMIQIDDEYEDPLDVAGKLINSKYSASEIYELSGYLTVYANTHYDDGGIVKHNGED
jgi:hypothetical protein